MRNWFRNNKRKAYIFVGLLFILLVLPLTLLLVKQTQDLRSKAAVPDKIETEQGVLSGAVTKLSDSLASGGQYVRFSAIQTTPTTTQPPSTSSTFGYGISAIGGKNNAQLREGAHAIRHTARIGGKVKYVRTPFTNRVFSYGGGDGGQYRVGYQTLNSSVFPSGTWVDGINSTEIVSLPIISGSFIMIVNFSDGPVLKKGIKYALVVENIHSNPNSNWSSWNLPNKSKANPYWDSEEDVAWLVGSSGVSGVNPYGWKLGKNTVKNLAPCWDTEYTDGRIEGVACIRTTHDDEPDRIGFINSSSDAIWSWEHFGSSIDMASINAFMWRISGSTNPTVEVIVNGVGMASGTFSNANSISSGGENNANWVRAVLSNTVRVNVEDDVKVIISTNSGEYRMAVMLMRDSDSQSNPMRSWPYQGNSSNFGTNPFRADDSSGPVWPSWYKDTTYMIYAEIQ